VDTLVGVRWVHFGASLLAAGTAVFPILVAPRLDARLRRQLMHVVWAALALAIVTGVLWLLIIAANILDVPFGEVWRDDDVWTVAIGTRFGHIACLRLALAIALGVLAVWPAASWATLATAAAFIGAIAAIGHAGAALGLRGDILFTSDILHLLAAAAWLGTLPALALLLVWTHRHEQPQLAVRATRRFSRLGIACVAVLLASGIANSWNLLSGPGDLIATDYGRLVLLKIVLFAAMLAIATVNRFHFTPRLPSAPAWRALARNSLAETALGYGILLAVGALGTMAPPAHHMLPPVDIPADATFVHIHGEKAMVDVTIDPGRPSIATASIRVMREDMSEFPARDVTLALEPPLPGPQPPIRAAVPRPDGTWQVPGIKIGQSGNWTVRVTIDKGSAKPIVLDGPIVINAK
jgi:putative copper resistance protein D